MFLLQQTVNKTRQRHQVSLHYAAQNLYIIICVYASLCRGVGAGSHEAYSSLFVCVCVCVCVFAMRISATACY